MDAEPRWQDGYARHQDGEEGPGARGGAHGTDRRDHVHVPGGERGQPVGRHVHGAAGGGNPILKAPSLAGKESWYLLTQLKKFKAGMRGGPADANGMLMQAQVATLPDEQAMNVRYLKALQSAYEDWIGRYDLGPTLVIETEKLDYLADLVDQLELRAALERLLHA